MLLPKDGESSSAVTKGDGASVNSSKVDSVAVEAAGEKVKAA